MKNLRPDELWGSENLKERWISNLNQEWISKLSRFVDATPLKQAVPSLKKGYCCFCRQFSDSRKQKKKRIRSLFPFEFSTKLEARTELMGIWILATVLYGNLLGSALLLSLQNSQHKITQNRVCNAFWWVFEWFSVIVITLEHVGHIPLRSNPICSRSDVANRKSSYRLEWVSYRDNRRGSMSLSSLS